MSHAALLFTSTFAVVFLLGLQQLLVHGRKYLYACSNSILIGISQLALFKIVPHQTTGIEIACYLAGGPLGIVCAMWLHDRIAHRKPKRDGNTPPRRDPFQTVDSSIGTWPATRRDDDLPIIKNEPHIPQPKPMR